MSYLIPTVTTHGESENCNKIENINGYLFYPYPCGKSGNICVDSKGKIEIVEKQRYCGSSYISTPASTILARIIVNSKKVYSIVVKLVSKSAIGKQAMIKMNINYSLGNINGIEKTKIGDWMSFDSTVGTSGTYFVVNVTTITTEILADTVWEYCIEIMDI